jgi:hypothetical protein
MDAKKIAVDAEGNLSIVMVEGRAFVHGGILDHECAKLRNEADELRETLRDILGVALNVQDPTHEAVEKMRHAKQLVGY